MCEVCSASLTTLMTTLQGVLWGMDAIFMDLILKWQSQTWGQCKLVGSKFSSSLCNLVFKLQITTIPTLLDDPVQMVASGPWTFDEIFTDLPVLEDAMIGVHGLGTMLAILLEFGIADFITHINMPAVETILLGSSDWWKESNMIGSTQASQELVIHMSDIKRCYKREKRLLECKFPGKVKRGSAPISLDSDGLNSGNRGDKENYQYYLM
ncbi:hypothetical protein L208DRAFT_1378511 [Tricholoma matsutake]|nr:hypothetical protein L208DRAFT_1378511 [Tricholoma matsutake 945]